jgi:hypothetical protein
MQLILGNVSILKSTPLPVAGSLTVSANFGMPPFTPLMLQTNSLPEVLQVISYLSGFYLLTHKLPVKSTFTTKYSKELSV